MNRLDLTLRSTIHIQYANAFAFDFFFFGSFFFVAVERQGYIQGTLSRFLLCLVRGHPLTPKNANNCGAWRSTNAHRSVSW